MDKKTVDTYAIKKITTTEKAVGAVVIPIYNVPENMKLRDINVTVMLNKTGSDIVKYMGESNDADNEPTFMRVRIGTNIVLAAGVWDTGGVSSSKDLKFLPSLYGDFEHIVDIIKEYKDRDKICIYIDHLNVISDSYLPFYIIIRIHGTLESK